MKNNLATTLTTVIPTLNAAADLTATLAALTAEAPEMPLLVCDGGSTDSTVAIARGSGARVILAPRGRGAQLAAGIAATETDWLLLLHADTRLEAGWRSAADAFIADPANASHAGFFEFALASGDPRARRLERLVAWRCRRLGLPYGDQGLLLARVTLASAGGMRALPLMEDVDLARRLGRDRLVPLAPRAVTSARRFENGGWYLRPARNLACLALWYAGAPPGFLVRIYA